MRPKTWLWRGHLLRGALEILAGTAGIGKSQAHCDLVARATRGDAWPDGTPGVQPVSVIMLTAEDSIDQEVLPRLVAAGAVLERVHFLGRVRRESGTERMFLLGEDIDTLEHNILKIGDVGLVTIDPITAFMGGADIHRASNVRAQLALLQDVAERTGVAVSTITHPPKGRGHRAIDQFLGSQAFIAACRIGHVAIEEVVEGEKTGRVLFANPKNSAHARMPTLAYRIAAHVVDQHKKADGDIISSHVVWDDDPVEVTADEALAAAAGRRCDGRGQATAKNAAVEFLRAVLADGPMPAKEIERLAVDAGLLEPTASIGDSKPFRQARLVLGVASNKAGMEDGWVWGLPKAPSDAQGALESERASSEEKGAFERSTPTPAQQAAVERAFQRAEGNSRRLAAQERAATDGQPRPPARSDA
jgi:hypothetical protein